MTVDKGVKCLQDLMKTLMTRNYFSTSAGKNIALSNEEALMRIVTFSSGDETEYDEDDNQSDNSFQL